MPITKTIKKNKAILAKYDKILSIYTHLSELKFSKNLLQSQKNAIKILQFTAVYISLKQFPDR